MLLLEKDLLFSLKIKKLTTNNKRACLICKLASHDASHLVYKIPVLIRGLASKLYGPFINVEVPVEKIVDVMLFHSIGNFFGLFCRLEKLLEITVLVET